MLIVFTVLSCGQCGPGTGSEPGGVTHAPQEGITWSTCSNWIFLNLKFSCQSTGTLGLQLQPCSRAWSSSRCQQPMGCPECSGTGDPGMGLLRVRSGLTPTLSPATTCWSPENRAAGGERMEQPGMGAALPGMEWAGWRVLKQGKNKGRRMGERKRGKSQQRLLEGAGERCSDSKALNN